MIYGRRYVAHIFPSFFSRSPRNSRFDFCRSCMLCQRHFRFLQQSCGRNVCKPVLVGTVARHSSTAGRLWPQQAVLKCNVSFPVVFQDPCSCLRFLNTSLTKSDDNGNVLVLSNALDSFFVTLSHPFEKTER